MIRFLQNEMIDKSRWDDCINHAANGNLNSLSWYLDIVSPGWCALIEDDYERVFPLTVSSKAGLKYIMQPYFTQQLGLFCRTLFPENKLEDFLSSIPPEYRYIDINLNISNNVPLSETISEMVNLELHLLPSYETLTLGYQTNLQRNLKKAGQNKLSLSKKVKPEEIITLFKTNKGRELKHLNEDQYKLMQRIANESISKGIGQIWGAFDESNQLVAAVLWVTSHKKSVFLFSSVSAQGKKLNAMPWLIDLFIRENSGNPVTLDFEGSNDEGLARFYGSFGAKKVIYLRFTRNSLPMLLQFALKIWRKNKRKLKLFA
ncbi:MAG: hypothetical protein ACOYN4_04445 [Bacteroidales bacterium]